MYVTSDKIFRTVSSVCAFNVENLEMIQAVISAADELKKPIIIQTTPSTLKYSDMGCIYACVKTLADRVDIPIALQLDHGNSFELCMQALKVGYSSIMIDGSALGFEENIALTSKVVEACKPNGVSVEAELGTVGGKEDDLEVSEGGYTDPEQALEFVQRTGVSSLAVAIGTAHGLYKSSPVLDLARLKKIRAKVDVPLVLHGGSGLTDDDVRDCVNFGIRKVNFATELRIAFSDGVRDAFKEDINLFDPKTYLKVARDRVKTLALKKMVSVDF